MGEPIKVAIQGIGTLGRGMAKFILQKPGIRLVGAMDINPALIGKDLGDILALGKKLNLPVSNNLENLLMENKPDLVLQATKAKISEIIPSLRQILKAGCSCITIAEEMCFPFSTDPVASRELNELAKTMGVTLLGTGINPGFILDYLIVAFTGICLSVDSVTATRVNDLSPYGLEILKTQGVGLTPEEFSLGVSKGIVVGHSGFPESINMIATALGWEVERIEELRKPIISAVKRKTESVTVNPGCVAGCETIAVGFVKGKPTITLIHPQQIYPHLEGIVTGDKIQIKGIPDISITITPEIPWVLGTIALSVNMIPQVLNSSPGLVSMIDLPIPYTWSQDILTLIKSGEKS